MSKLTVQVPQVEKDKIINLYCEHRLTYKQLSSRFSRSRDVIWKVIKEAKANGKGRVLQH